MSHQQMGGSDYASERPQHPNDHKIDKKLSNSKNEWKESHPRSVSAMSQMNMGQSEFKQFGAKAPGVRPLQQHPGRRPCGYVVVEG